MKPGRSDGDLRAAIGTIAWGMAFLGLTLVALRVESDAISLVALVTSVVILFGPAFWLLRGGPRPESRAKGRGVLMKLTWGPAGSPERRRDANKLLLVGAAFGAGALWAYGRGNLGLGGLLIVFAFLALLIGSANR